MKNKKVTAITFVLAGAMVLGGTGALTANMSRAQEKEVNIQVERSATQKAEVDTSVQNTEKASFEKKTWQEEDGIYLPEGAVIKERKDEEYTITWKDYHITYYQGDVFEKEEKADIGFGEAIQIASKTIKKYSNQDISGMNISIQLLKNTDSGGKKAVDNTRNYGIRYYAIWIQGLEEHEYLTDINSVTGAVYQYSDFYTVPESKEELIDNRVVFDGYTECELGYGLEKSASDKEIHEFYEKTLDKAKKLYMPIVKAFIEENLQLGKVKKSFGCIPGEMIPSDGSSRNTLSFVCQTENQDIVEIQIDQVMKTVQSFCVNPLFYELNVVSNN